MAEKILHTRIINKNATLSEWNSSTLVLKQGEIALAKIASASNGTYDVPTYGAKIGDGTNVFKDLKWLVAPASDVYAWAKLEDPTIDQLPETLKGEIKALKAAIGEGGSVADAIKAAVEALDVTDTAVDGEFVTAVSEADGKVSITRRALTADDIPTLQIAKIEGLQDALDAKIAKEDGKSLIADTEITRLAGMSDGANKVEASETNGNIKIDGAEVNVYTLPAGAEITDDSARFKEIFVPQYPDEPESEDGTTINTDRVELLSPERVVSLEKSNPMEGEASGLFIDVYQETLDEYGDGTGEYVDYKTQVTQEHIVLKTDNVVDVEINRQGIKTPAIILNGTDLDTRIADIEANFGEGEGTVADQIADAVKGVQDNVDALDERVGDIPAGATATTVVGYVDEKVADAVAAEKERAEGVEAGLQTQINTIMNNPDTEGVINSINEFTQYIEDHGEIAEGFRTDIDKNKEDIAANAKAIADQATSDAATYETKTDATSKLTEAKGYTDTAKAAVIGTAEDASTADTVYGAKKYAEEKATAAQTAAETNAAADAAAKVKALADGAVKNNTDAIAAINNETTGILKQAKDYADGLAGNYAAAEHDHVVADITDFDTSVRAIVEGYTYATVAQVGTAKEEAIAAAAADATTKADAASKHADDLNTAMDTRVQAVEANAIFDGDTILIDCGNHTEATQA